MEYDTSTNEKTLFRESPETCGLLGFYEKLMPSFMLSNFPLQVVLLCYGTKYNNIEWNPFSS
jgi:hypothetical protein